MFRLLLAFVLAAGSCYLYVRTVSSRVVAQDDEFRQIIPGDMAKMNLEQSKLSIDSSGIAVEISQLVCRNQLSPPSGVAYQPNRDIGLAFILIQFENRREITQIVTIQDVTIQNSSDGRSQSFRFEPRIIELRPLEHASVDIHLSNQAGYGSQDRMIAIVTYEIDGQTYIIQSEAVDVVKS